MTKDIVFPAQSLFDKTASQLANEAESNRFQEVRPRRDIAEMIVHRREWPLVSVEDIRASDVWFSRS